MTAVALAALVAGGTGCGAMINGTSRTITVRSSTPGAEVYLNGGLVGAAPAKVVTGNAAAQVVTVHAPGHRDKDVVLKPKVKGAPIALDVLCSLTIIGVAAPISDGLLGTFVALEPAELDVTLDPAGVAAATPVREFRYAPGDMAIAAAPPPPPPAPPAAPAGPPMKCKARTDCKGGLTCTKGICAAPECNADAECGAGKYCTLDGSCAAQKKR